MTTSLELGCDCLGEIRYVDAVLSRHPGRAVRRSRTRSACTRRTTRSCGSTSTRSTPAPRSAGCAGWWSPSTPRWRTTSTCVYWRFYQDGNIECEVRATGIMVTTPFASSGTEPPATGTVVDQRTYAPFHQHFLVARLDLDVDGGPEHRDGGRLRGVAGRRRRTRTGWRWSPRRRRSRRRPSPPATSTGSTQRAWKVVNPNKLERARHDTGATSWCPTAAFPVLMDPATPQYRRAPVMGHTLWVTRHHDDEKWPAGDVSRRRVRPTTWA